MEYIKVMEMLIPSKNLVNDNTSSDYKSRMGKLNWIKEQAILGVNYTTPDIVKHVLCWAENKEKVYECIGKPKENKIGLIGTHFKVMHTFDPQNYVTTYKYMIDILTKFGYWSDDSHRDMCAQIYVGADDKDYKENNIFLHFFHFYY